MNPAWLDWAQRLQAIAQTGLTYAADPYDVERYQQIREIAAEIAAAHSDAGFERISGLFADQAGYATPKVDVRGAVFRDDMILLVKERSDGGWTLPGGWADVGDSPAMRWCARSPKNRATRRAWSSCWRSMIATSMGTRRTRFMPTKSSFCAS